VQIETHLLRLHLRAGPILADAAGMRGPMEIAS